MDGVGVLFKKRSDANADEAAEAVFSELQRQVDYLITVDKDKPEKSVSINFYMRNH